MAEKPQLVVATATPPATTGPQPPANLGEAGADLWRRVTGEYDIRDVGGRELLAQACAAADRANRLAEVIERDGEVTYGKTGPRSHPAIRDEIACRAFICRTLQRLGLDVEPVRSAPGRPGHGGIGWRP